MDLNRAAYKPALNKFNEMTPMRASPKQPTGRVRLINSKYLTFTKAIVFLTSLKATLVDRMNVVCRWWSTAKYPTSYLCSGQVYAIAGNSSAKKSLFLDFIAKGSLAALDNELTPFVKSHAMILVSMLCNLNINVVADNG